MDSMDHLPFVTIDSPTTRDIDDAFGIHSIAGGGVEVAIAIADPTRVVPLGSKVDLAAQALAATVYVRDSPSQRMLPAEISEDQASLLQGRSRDAMVVRMVLDDSWSVDQFAVEFAPVLVTKRLSYEEIPALSKADGEPVAEMLRLASVVASELLARRQRSGALALFDVGRRVMTDEEGRLLRLPSAGAMVGHLIIQELMILTNASVARFMVSQNIPALYRNHVPQLAAPLASDLATSLQAWIASGSADADAIAARLQVAVGRAQYEPTLGGHYGLALESYTHCTSPLRRYADLVNLRQLKAHVQRQEYPYSQGELQSIGRSINQTIVERKEGASEGYKEALRSRTQAALQQERLTAAPDHVLVQAIKLMAEAGAVDEALSTELRRRIERAALTDKVADALLGELPPEIWPKALVQDFMSWVVAEPGRPMHLLVHGKQVGVFASADVQATGEGTSFNGVCRIVYRGAAINGRGTGFRKRDAEQRAVVAAVAAWLGGEEPPALPVATDAVANAGVANPKGALLERLQALGWPYPVFTHSVRGPSHAPHFSVLVAIESPGRKFQVEGSGASKRQAEADACEQLYAQVCKAVPAAPPAPAGGADNPVGALQERAQQRKVRMPDYEIRTKQANPPIFEAVVTVHEAAEPMSYSGFSSSKADAKRQAAAKALLAVQTP